MDKAKLTNQVKGISLLLICLCLPISVCAEVIVFRSGKRIDKKIVENGKLLSI